MPHYSAQVDFSNVKLEPGTVPAAPTSHQQHAARRAAAEQLHPTASTSRKRAYDEIADQQLTTSKDYHQQQQQQQPQEPPVRQKQPPPKRIPILQNPSLPDDVVALIGRFPDLYPHEVPRKDMDYFQFVFDELGDQASGYDLKQLNKMVRRWHRAGMVTGFYRAIGDNFKNAEARSRSQPHTSDFPPQAATER